MFGKSIKLVYLDFSEVITKDTLQPFINAVIDRLQNLFSNVNIAFITEPPQEGPYMTINFKDIVMEKADYYGIADHKENVSIPDGNAEIRIDNFLDDLSQGKISDWDGIVNFSANTIAHEVGHILGLEHTLDSSDIMCSGENLDHDMFTKQLQFTPDEITLMNSNLENEGIVIDNDVISSDINDSDDLSIINIEDNLDSHLETCVDEINSDSSDNIDENQINDESINDEDIINI